MVFKAGKRGRQAELDLVLAGQDEPELLALRGLVDKALDRLSREKEALRSVPLSIFASALSPGEALVKYLRENRSMRLSEISRILNRNENCLWLNYQRAVGKKARFIISHNEGAELIPLSIFQRPSLSYLEAITLHLRRERGLRNSEVSALLRKSVQVVSIAYGRALSKLDSPHKKNG